MVKKISILAIIFITAFAFWVTVKPWVEAETKFVDWQGWLWPLGWLVVLAAVTGLGLLFTKELLYRILISILIALAFLIVFDFNPLYPGTFTTLILLHLYAGKVIGEEAVHRHKINPRLIMRRGLPWVITPLLIMVSFAYYSDPKVQATAYQNELPATTRQTIAKTITAFLAGELKDLSPAERQQAERQVTNQTIAKFTELLQPYFRFSPPILAFGLFLVLQGLSLVFVWFSVWLAMLLFFVLKRAGFVKIMEKQVTAEVIEF